LDKAVYYWGATIHVTQATGNGLVMQDKKTHPTLIQVFKSVFSAMIGIQKRHIHERDFTQGQPSSYIFAGLFAVTVFVLILVGLVQLILYFASR
jgi:hypothetical protein